MEATTSWPPDWNISDQATLPTRFRPGPTLTRDPLEEFLFNRRRGFCEHFAAAYATLMRAAGVPARIVLGYQGGRLNWLGSHLTILQSDAHAWCEVWLPGRGWHRVDPTGVVAPIA